MIKDNLNKMNKNFKNHKKEKLNIPPLKTIREILSDLKFLKYSTRKRNLAYQIQYQDFLLKLLESYYIYGSLKNILFRQYVVTVTNIVEYLLFVSLHQIYGKAPKTHKIPRLIGQARSKKIISRELGRDLNKINDLRNRIHPSKQKNHLDINSFNKNEVQSCSNILDKLIEEVRDFFVSKKIKVNSKLPRCPYEDYHILYFLDNERCPYCGKYGYE